jgi:hypothetical protein
MKLYKTTLRVTRKTKKKIKYYKEIKENLIAKKKVS